MMFFLIKPKMKKFSFLRRSILANAGFTLVEMITALAIFSIVMTIVVGALLSVLGANRQSQSIQVAINNLNLSLEMVSRELRMGHNYHCGNVGAYDEAQDCVNGADFIAFEPYNGNPSSSDDQVHFWLQGGRIMKSTDNGVSALPLTSPELVLEGLQFYVAGTASADKIQPRALITMDGYVDRGSMGDRGKTYFNLQTTVSQRLMDF